MVTQNQANLIKNMDDIAINERRSYILNILQHAFYDLDPANIIQRSDKIACLLPDGIEKIYVAGIGKAAEKMYAGISSRFGNIIEKALIIIPDDDPVTIQDERLQIMRGTHPFPSEKSVESGRKLLEFISKIEDGSTILFLISGGGSAIFEVPDSRYTLNDILGLTKCLMNSGADINDLNTVRISLSAVKGGKLLNFLSGKKIFALYISDVPFDNLSYIASGPLIPMDSVEKPSDVLRKYSCQGTDKKFMDLKYNKPVFTGDIQHLLILRNYDFVSNIASHLRKDGYPVLDLGSSIGGEVGRFSEDLVRLIRDYYAMRRKPFWFVGGGETTVNVHGKGYGGRSQQCSLMVLSQMGDNEDFLFISAGTDGIDGHSEAMGGIVDSDTKKKIDEHAMRSSIDNNDSYTILSRNHSAIMSGRTGNNVSDIFVGYYAGETGRKKAD